MEVAAQALNSFFNVGVLSALTFHLYLFEVEKIPTLS